MSFELGISRRRRERQNRIRFLVRGFYLLLLGGVGWSGYHMGLSEGQFLVADMERRQATLNATLKENAAQVEEAVRRRDMARAEADALKVRYEQDIPKGDRRKLLALIEERVAEGVEPARLDEIIRLARNRMDCDFLPQMKRVAIASPIAPGDGATFASGSLTVTGSGLSARNAAGQPEAWFDPASPVTMRFTRIGGDGEGEKGEVSGTLPLYHSLVIGDFQYRITVTAGERRFVNVAVDRCSYP